MPPLFDRAIALAGLSPLLGPGTMRRALKDVGAAPETATVEHYLRCIPKLEARLRSFYSEGEAQARAKKLYGLRDDK